MRRRLKEILKNIIRGQKGQTLPMVLVLLLIGSLLIAPTLNYASTSLKGHQVIESNILELYSADSGIEDALHWLIKGRQANGPWGWDEGQGFGERQIYNINARPVDVTLKRRDDMGANIYKITSTATSADGGSTTVLSTVWAIPFFEDGTEFTHQNPPPPGDIHINGDATVGINVAITGNITASGSITLENHSSITGDAFIHGDLTLQNHTLITGDIICVTGNITLGNTADINADIHLLGEDCTITINQPNATITGNIWADGNLTINIMEGSVSTVEILGSIYAPSGNIGIYLGEENSEVRGDVFASGTISITGEGKHTGEEFSSYTGDPPFTIAPCPDFPTGPVIIFTYEIT